MDYPNFKVLVRCFTFNQANYICDTLDGFCLQQTNFPFICCIVDDASTDGEQNVIKQYLEKNFCLDQAANCETDDYNMVYALHKSNKNCYFAVYNLKYNHYRKKAKYPYLDDFRKNCKYEAICEGDDYWISDSKLQKQFDALENNPECSLCVHPFYKLINGKLEKVDTFQDRSFIFGKKEWMRHWLTQPLTTLYRLDAFPSDKERNKYKNYMDNHLFYLILSKGDGYNIGEYMGVYRISGEGTWTSQNRLGRYRSDVSSYRELYENHKDDGFLKSKLISVYSTYIYLSIKNCQKYEKIPFSLIGLNGKVVAAIKVFKKLIFGMSH